jgi:hypothetical protein
MFFFVIDSIVIIHVNYFLCHLLSSWSPLGDRNFLLYVSRKVKL